MYYSIHPRVFLTVVNRQKKVWQIAEFSHRTDRNRHCPFYRDTHELLPNLFNTILVQLPLHTCSPALLLFLCRAWKNNFSLAKLQ